MLPSDLKLKIKTGTVGYNNKILVSNGNFILGKNEKVNSLEAPSAPQAETPAIKNHKTNSLETPTVKTHKTNPFSSFFNWNIYNMVHFSMKVSHQFNKNSSKRPFCMGHPLRYINHMSVSLIINRL